MFALHARNFYAFLSSIENSPSFAGVSRRAPLWESGFVGRSDAAGGRRRRAQAQACFEEAAAEEPGSVKALGNWGNALLAHGQARAASLPQESASGNRVPLATPPETSAPIEYRSD